MKEIAQKLLSQVLELWVLPEITKRKQEKIIDDEFSLRAAQIIFSKDRGWNKVRLNTEVKAIMHAKLNNAKIKGDTIQENDLGEIRDIKLTEQDPNCGHITILKIKDQWILSFNFLYNAGRARERVDAANEFLESASENMKNKRLRPFFENAFACAELLTEAILIRFFDKESLTGHRSRLSKIEKWAELGNVSAEFSTTLKLLTRMRSSARYMSSNEFKRGKPEDIINTLHKMNEHASEMLE